MQAVLYYPGQDPKPVALAGLTLSTSSFNQACAVEYLDMPGFVVETLDQGDSHVAFCLTGPMGQYFGPPAWEAIARLRELTGNFELFPTPAEAAADGRDQQDDEDEFPLVCGPVLIVTA